MDSALENSSQEQESLAGNEMENLGNPQESEGEGESPSSEESEGNSESGQSRKRPTGWERLKRKNRENEMEIRNLHARISEMQSGRPQSPSHDQSNPYGGQPQGIDEQIHKAVSYALQHKEMEERKAQDAQKHAHVQKQYHELQKHLDSAGDKYDDFDDVVRGEDANFTPHMRDAALFLPRKGNGSAAEVLYRLGKNPDELKRIANLHPLDQATEMVRLSHALIGENEAKNTSSNRPLGQIKSNPVTNSRSITEKTPVSELRARMKAGWK